MHFNKLLAPVLVVVAVLVFAVGGLYFYSIGQEKDIILELTFEQLQTLEKPDRVSFEATTTTTAFSLDPEDMGQEVVLPSTVSGSVTEDLVAVTTPAGELSFTVEEFLATNPFGDVQVWLDEIRAGNYTTESVGEGDNAVWEHTFTSDVITQSYVQTIGAQLQAVAAAGAPGFTLSNPEITYNGGMTFVVTIGSSDNIIDGIDITADAPVELTFDLVSEEAGTVPAAASYTDLVSDVNFTEFTLQDGQSIPTNPLLVWLASFM